MGTADIAVRPLLELIRAGHNAKCVVTQPDKPNSRGKKIVFNAVKRAALEKGIEVYQPDKASSPESEEHLRSFDADVVVVCAYGQLLKSNILEMTPYGCINLHASLLPGYRGAAPINRVIMNGEKKTGISVMYMDAGLDTGDVMFSKQVEINDSVTAGGLTIQLSEIAAECAVEALSRLERACAYRYPQDDEGACYAEKITKEECVIDFSLPARKVFDHIRGLDPEPGARTFLNGKSIKIFALRCEEDDMTENVAPGTVTGIIKQRDSGKPDGLSVACGKGSIVIETLKPEGKAVMRSTDFYNGLRNMDVVKFGR